MGVEHRIEHGLGKGKRTPRPTGAYKLLAFLLYARHKCIEPRDDGVVRIYSAKKIGATLGTTANNIKIWLAYLETMGYLDNVSRSHNRRSYQFHLRRPRNI